MTNETDEHGIAQKIKDWDCEEITTLQSYIEDLTQICGDFEMVGVDITALPSEEIPDDIDTGYPVWAMDKHKMCLVGESLDSVESLDDIRGFEYSNLNLYDSGSEIFTATEVEYNEWREENGYICKLSEFVDGIKSSDFDCSDFHTWTFTGNTVIDLDYLISWLLKCEMETDVCDYIFNTMLRKEMKIINDGE